MVKNRVSDKPIELYEKLVYVGRSTKVVKGGRKFRFGAIVVIGDKRGRVGVGFGKATEVVNARAKATQAARRNMVKIPLREGRTLHHDIEYKYCAGKVIMKSAPPGTGIIAGGSVRALMEVLGIADVVVKSVASSNPHNMLFAALEGLKAISSPRYIAEKRGKRIGELFDYARINNRASALVNDSKGVGKSAAKGEKAITDKNVISSEGSSVAESSELIAE